MYKKIIGKLKNVGIIRTNVKKLKKVFGFIAGMPKRNPGLMFHSSNVSLSRSYGLFLPDNKGQAKIAAIDNNGVAGLSLYKDVLSYPLKQGTKKDYSGGLADGKTHVLIEEAIHLGDKGQFSQELLKLDIDSVIGNDLPEISQLVLFGGIMFNHFGHFLLESLGRLWAYDYVKDLDPYILFYSDSENAGYLEKNNFIYQVFSGFGIPHKNVLFINYIARIKQVIIPVQKYGYTHRLNPDHIFLTFIDSFRYASIVPKKFKHANKIYVSRSKIPVGKPVGENYFEDYLRHEGYAIFHPELYVLQQQLAIYNKADRIIFCDGAAIHACVLLPALKAEVAVIARRRDRRWDGRNIIDQFDGYHKKVLWIDCIKDQYQFGLESWHALSIVDWYQVSIKLKEEMYVNNLCMVFEEVDFLALLRSELHNYITSIIHLPEYIEFMVRLKEQLPVKTVEYYAEDQSV